MSPPSCYLFYWNTIGDPQFEEIIKEEHARLASSSPLSWQGLVTAASSLTSFLGTSTSNSSSSSSSSSQSSSENQGSLSQVEEVYVICMG